MDGIKGFSLNSMKLHKQVRKLLRSRNSYEFSCLLNFCPLQRETGRWLSLWMTLNNHRRVFYVYDDSFILLEAPKRSTMKIFHVKNLLSRKWVKFLRSNCFAFMKDDVFFSSSQPSEKNSG
jgi:hypothetical protein